MMKRINKKTKQGQAALILILLAAVGLIVYAITLNWGHIAQNKALLTVAADEGASMLASDAASYGEMQKQTNLKDKNQLSGSTGILLDIFLVVLTIVSLVFFPAATPFLYALEVAAVVMSIANLVLQLVVVQPGITALWNSLQKNQPMTQQFYEGGISTTLEGSVTDQVTVTDYFDSNANGRFGQNNNFPNDTISRFALFYTDRLKMLNKPLIPQVVTFYDLLDALLHGETCAQNEIDHSRNPGLVPLNPACPSDCANNPLDPACQVKIPNLFQLTDECLGSDPSDPTTYSPYCDPCCQPAIINGKSVRPSNCPEPDSNGSDNTDVTRCLVNNPYDAYGSFPYIYDPAFQDYAAGKSFLAQFGRDETIGTPPFSLTPDVIFPPTTVPVTRGVAFPNGVFPFFWLTNPYSLVAATAPSIPEYNHWCIAPLAPVPPTGYGELSQLTLSYPNCQGPDCCVGYIGGSSLPGGANAAGPINYLSGGPTSVPAPSALLSLRIDSVGLPTNPGADPSFGEEGSGLWLQGDNQMCSLNWLYNGADSNFQDGTCEWTNSTSDPAIPPSPSALSTVDSLDDTMHTLSDFVNFSNTFLGHDVGTLSSTFQTWYPQLAIWVSCDGGDLCGACNNGRLPTLLSGLNHWNTLITNFLNATYVGTGWCVPAQSTLFNSGISPAEGNYINTNGGAGPWGDLPHVIACENYNANAAPIVAPFQKCLDDLAIANTTTMSAGPAGPGNPTCTALPPSCNPALLGRSLAGAAPTFHPSTVTNCPATQPVSGCPVGCPASACVPGPNACPAPVCTTAGDGHNDTIQSCNVGTCQAPVPQPPGTTTPGSPDGTTTPLGTTTVVTSTASCPTNCTTAVSCGCFPCPAGCDPNCLNWHDGSCDRDCLFSNGNQVCQKPFGCTPPAGGGPDVCTCSLDCNGPMCAPDMLCNDGIAACVLGSSPPQDNCSCGKGSCSNPCPDGCDDQCPTCNQGATACTGADCIDYSSQSTYQSQDCDSSIANSYANWVQNTITLANDEASKFGLRAGYLQEVYNQAKPMPGIFQSGSQAIGDFLNGPVAQLTQAYCQPAAATPLPNSVIYGWVDKTSIGTGGCTDPSTGNKTGCAHIVKVTAYAPGRNINQANLQSYVALSSLQNITTSSSGFLHLNRTYTLNNKDGYVYVSVKRWDEDPIKPVSFPNGRPLWQFLYHNPNGGTATAGHSLIAACNGLSLPNGRGLVGFGLEPMTVAGLGYAGILPKDVTTLGNAFMLNDNAGSGKVDINATNPGYSSCLSQANQLLNHAPESHMCAEYIASIKASGPSGPDDNDYSVKFVDCKNVPGGNPPDDLAYGE